MSGSDVVVIHDDDEEVPLTRQADAPILDDDSASEKLPEGLVAVDDNYALKLNRPIKLQFKSADGKTRDEPFDRLPIRRLTGKDMREMMLSDRRDGSILLLEKAVMLPVSRVGLILDRLDARDLTRAMGVVAFLANGSPPTGR